ncbi:TIGR02678 family protein [Burkholderia sp. Ac-20345]|uniref:TIGR02678 family protein n=1 Tax=Burkholderia sp. Ac-20345 TaxID=2703891 RepID=UPI00197CABED|nr:TIGR02678 family protein [Burkholderia sp. Ac-20345]MBN3777266.1 TIGR02678 family protein [Burkholderia sp. Ac-20345]
MRRAVDTQSIGQHQEQQAKEERQDALRALLMQPLMNSNSEMFPAVRRHAEHLRDWFAREAGWPLHIERDGARLYKRPADLEDTSRGLRDFDKRRYILLCLVCAVLERADTQTTLAVLGDTLLTLVDDPSLVGRGFTYGLESRSERGELVTVCKALLELGVLNRVVGDEDAYVQAPGAEADALYDINRRQLSGVLAAVRGPSTWPVGDSPISLEERLHSLVDEHIPDTDEGRRTAVRRNIARRLLDDPVLYVEELSDDARSYFLNQRGAIAARLADGTGMSPEQRAEGLAMVDDDGELTDIAMPAEGTDAHVTLLVAELLCSKHRQQTLAQAPSSDRYSMNLIAAHIGEIREEFGKYWRRSAREAGGEGELAEIAVGRLQMLRLIRREDDWVIPLPALARFSLGETELKPVGGSSSQVRDLFDDTQSK